MSRFELQPQGRQQFRKASRQAIKDYFVSFPAHERCAKWIRKNNPYRRNCISQYAQDFQRQAVNHGNLVSYVAASGPTHVIDGWSFVGRAIQALLRRDSYAAIHFGYYAELRAAMALLACEGIGILKNNHPIVIAANHTIRLPKCRMMTDTGRWENRWAQTHAVIVPCLKYWSTLRRAADLLDSIVQPGGIALSAWLSECGAHAKAHAIAKTWLNAWGLDLAQINTDHDARNLVSYRPSEFRRPSAIEVKQIATFIRDLWRLFEPSPNLKFMSLESNLLRLALRKGGVIKPAVRNIEALGFTTAEATAWANSLATNQQPIPFVEANKVSSIESGHCSMQVIARAVLLLYIATRAAGLHLSEAGYTRSDLEFWWRQFGIDRGLWEESGVPDDPRDAWADIGEGLNGLERILSGNHVGLNALRREVGAPLDQLGAWEIVAVWGLVP